MGFERETGEDEFQAVIWKGAQGYGGLVDVVATAWCGIDTEGEGNIGKLYGRGMLVSNASSSAFRTKRDARLCYSMSVLIPRQFVVANSLHLALGDMLLLSLVYLRWGWCI